MTRRGMARWGLRATCRSAGAMGESLVLLEGGSRIVINKMVIEQQENELIVDKNRIKSFETTPSLSFGGLFGKEEEEERRSRRRCRSEIGSGRRRKRKDSSRRRVSIRQCHRHPSSSENL